MKKTIAFVSALAVVFCCSFPAMASTTSHKYNGYYNILPADAPDLGEYFNWYVTRPYTTDFNYNYDQDRFYYYTSNTATYPVERDYSSSGMGNLYNVDLSISCNFQNAQEYLYEGNSSAINIEFSFTQDQPMDSYWIECLSDDYEIVSVGNGYIQFKCNNPYLAYRGHFSLPRGANTTLSFVVHFVYRYSSGVGNVAGYSPTSGVSFDTNKSYISNVVVGILAPSSWTHRTNITAHYSDIINFGDIKSAMEEIHNDLQGNQSVVDDITDQSSTIDNDSNIQHQQEQSYFDNTQSALNDTGIGHFQFDSDVSSGLSGLKDDFTRVWTSCGTLSQFWIASLTIGLALSIIRHRKMFQK